MNAGLLAGIIFRRVMENKKILVASDIHGSMLALDRVLELARDYEADKVILLGDIFGTNASEMVEKLNTIANKLTVVKGNNDWYFEPENARFKIFEQTYENIGGKIAYVCHGHRLNDMALSSYGAKIIMQGHLHRPFIEKQGEIIRVCPGSIASPRFGSEKSFALIDGKKLQILTLYGDLIDEIEL